MLPVRFFRTKGSPGTVKLVFKSSVWYRVSQSRMNSLSSLDCQGKWYQAHIKPPNATTSICNESVLLSNRDLIHMAMQSIVQNSFPLWNKFRNYHNLLHIYFSKSTGCINYWKQAQCNCFQVLCHLHMLYNATILCLPTISHSVISMHFKSINELSMTKLLVALTYYYSLTIFF